MLLQYEIWHGGWMLRCRIIYLMGLAHCEHIGISACMHAAHCRKQNPLSKPLSWWISVLAAGALLARWHRRALTLLKYLLPLQQHVWHQCVTVDKAAAVHGYLIMLQEAASARAANLPMRALHAAEHGRYLRDHTLLDLMHLAIDLAELFPSSPAVRGQKQAYENKRISIGNDAELCSPHQHASCVQELDIIARPAL